MTPTPVHVLPALGAPTVMGVGLHKPREFQQSDGEFLMGSRGRKSADSMAVVPAQIGPEGVISMRRPAPPPELNEAQAQEWRRVVNRLPATYFPAETWPLLADFCRHITSANRVAEMIATLEVEMAKASVEEGSAAIILSAAQAYDRLLKMADREGRAMAAQARQLRLTLQSVYSNRKQKPPASLGPKLWDREQ